MNGEGNASELMLAFPLYFRNYSIGIFAKKRI